jgi:hypothetical protein
MNNVPDTPGPAIEIRFTIQTAMDAAKYNTYKQTHNEVTDTKKYDRHHYKELATQMHY